MTVEFQVEDVYHFYYVSGATAVATMSYGTTIYDANGIVGLAATSTGHGAIKIGGLPVPATLAGAGADCGKDEHLIRSAWGYATLQLKGLKIEAVSHFG